MAHAQKPFELFLAIKPHFKIFKLKIAENVQFGGSYGKNLWVKMDLKIPIIPYMGIRFLAITLG